jgi:outer membrane lipoprotein-sorting protein
MLGWTRPAPSKSRCRQEFLLKPRFFFCAAIALWAFACFAPAITAQNASVTVDNVLGMMDKSAGDFHTLTANVEYIKYTAVVKDSSSETGQILVRRDQKMRIDFTKPDPRTILRTGDSLFIYTPKIKRVEEYNLGKDRALVDQYLSLGFGTKSQMLRKNYDVALTGQEDIDNRKTFLLELTPKFPEVRKQITKVQMWIDPSSWLPLQQKFLEAGSDDYLLIKYSSLMKNLKVNDSKFKPDWPKDVTHVKPRQ